MRLMGRKSRSFGVFLVAFVALTIFLSIIQTEGNLEVDKEIGTLQEVSPEPSPSPEPEGGGGEGSPAPNADSPVIKAKWELPDMDPFKPRCQVWPAPGTWDPSTAMETEGKVILQIWVVVTHDKSPDYIMAVQNEVWDSEGTMKWQEPMVRVTDYTAIEDAVELAVSSEQITQTLADDILLEVSKNEAYVYVYEGLIDTHQPAGIYTAVAYATDFAGKTSEKIRNNFEVYSMLAYAIDFDVLDFGTMIPLFKDRVSGNEVMDPMTNPGGQNNNAPTIKNLGNTPLTLSLYFEDMVGETQGKIINVFDATFMSKTIDPISSSQWVEFSPAKLDRCSSTQIDFSVVPGQYVTSDTYRGAVRLTVIPPKAEES